MKITFISTILTYPWGGADTLWTRAAEDAAERGDQIQLIISALTRNHPRIDALAAHGAEIIIRPATTTRSTAARVWHRLRGANGRAHEIIRPLERFQPDVVIVSCGGTYDLLLEPALIQWLQARSTRLRVIANFQLENPNLSEADRVAIAAILDRADRAFFVSTRNLGVTRRHLQVPLSRASVLHNPLRADITERPFEYPSASPIRFATVGRLEHGKGLELALYSLAEVLGRAPGWELDIFGRGPKEPQLVALIKSLQLTDRVRLAGYVSALSDIWQNHHLLLSPSLDDGVPMTIPEAMMSGRPVLATAVGGAEDWITPAQNGYICPAPTVPLFSATLDAAWQDRQHWKDFGARAAADARAFYRPNDYKQLIEL